MVYTAQIARSSRATLPSQKYQQSFGEWERRQRSQKTPILQSVKAHFKTKLT